jgi:DNA-binding CsgD family transcriptional regulator/tetratricopeptide (TPR) repeat protein
MAVRYSSSQFVGRERELAAVASSLESAAEGRTSTLFLTGTAGIGSSRLLDESGRRLGRLEVPFDVLRGRAWDGGEPYGPVIEAFARPLAALDDVELARVLGPAAEAFAGLIPDLAPRVSALGLLPARPWIVSRDRRQARLLEGIRGVLERLGESRPVVLALEDLHAADAGTRSLVAFLARVTRPGRFCVIASYQPDVLTRDHPFRRDLAAAAESTRPARTIELGPLDQVALAELIAGIEGERPGATLLLLVAERSSGNPLVAEEVLAARRELSAVSVTGTVEQLVAARLAHRSPECRRVLRLLASVGVPLSVGELAAAAAAFEAMADGLPPRSSTGPRHGDGVLDADLAAGLLEAVEAGLVVPNGDATDGFAPDTRIPVRHELIARAIVADLLPAQRRRLHAALGVALTVRPFSRYRHLLDAHETDAARAAALDAASSSAAVDAPRDTLAALELAIELELPASDQDARRESSRLLARAAEASYAGDLAGRAVAFAEAAIARLGERADRLELGLLFDRLARFRRVTGDQAGALVAHHRAVELIAASHPRERALALAGLAQVLMLDGQFTASERCALEAIEVARSAGGEARAEEGHAICTLGIARAWGDRAEEAPALLEEAGRIAEETRRFDDMFRANANLTTALDLLGQRERSIAVAREGIEEARGVGLETVYGNFIRGNVAEGLFLAGRWDEARDWSLQALEWAPSGASVLESEATLAMIEIESSAGEAAARRLGRLLLALETNPDRQFVGAASQAAASFALWRGDVADAARSAELGWSIALPSEDWLLISTMAVTLAEVLAATADDARERRELGPIAAARARAAEVLAVAESAVGRMSADRSVAARRAADASLATVRAFKARLDGHDRATVWDSVARQWERAGDPYQVARARWRQAEAALTENDARAGRRLARGPLREAVQLARSLGARPLLRRLEELAERALIALPEAPKPVGSARGDGTSPDEVEQGRGAGSLPRGATAEVLARAFVDAPAARRTNVFELSAREREVLGLIAQGRTNREIGERLFISQKTVGVHVGNVLAKMRVSGRVEAATVAIRLGLTEPEPERAFRS